MTPEERQAKVKWLSRYRILENQIKRLEAEAERWRSRTTNTVPAPVHFKYYDSSKETDQKVLATMTRQELRRNNMLPVVVHGSGGGLGIDDCVAEIDELVREISDKIRQAIAVRKSIEKVINSVEDDRMRLIMDLRYIDGLKWENICCETNYSWKQVHRIHNQALGMIFLKDDTK